MRGQHSQRLDRTRRTVCRSSHAALASRPLPLLSSRLNVRSPRVCHSAASMRCWAVSRRSGSGYRSGRGRSRDRAEGLLHEGSAQQLLGNIDGQEALVGVAVNEAGHESRDRRKRTTIQQKLPASRYCHLSSSAAHFTAAFSTPSLVLYRTSSIGRAAANWRYVHQDRTFCPNLLIGSRDNGDARRH